VEDQIRDSGLDYTIIRAGVLLNRPGGEHEIEITQQLLPLSWRYRIARADVAQVFVAALDHPKASHATFEVVWGRHGKTKRFEPLLESLRRDDNLKG
jgi:uncharacterized protein YbjT (DUF2867 family)